MLFFRLEPRLQFDFNKAGLPSEAEVEAVDIFFNHTSAKMQLMRGIVSWRGGREKDPGDVQYLIEALTKPGAVVLDAYASTGALIHACRRSGRHLVAFKNDTAIFNLRCAINHQLMLLEIENSDVSS